MIIVGGENLIDFIEVESADSSTLYKANVGGAPYNCAKALGRQQVRTGYLTPISSDSLGDLIATALVDSNVAILAPRRPEPTSLAVVSIHHSVPSYQFYRENTAERNVAFADLVAATPQDAGALYIGSLALTDGADADIWADYYCAMRERGIFTALDPNIRANFIHDRNGYLARFERVIRHTDLLKLSDEDLAWLSPDTEVEEAARQLLARSSAQLLVVTLGDKGAFGLVAERKVSVPSAKVRALADTVGAGDTFMATLLARLDRLGALKQGALGAFTDQEIESLLTWAACAAALNCEENGCEPPRWEALKSRMRGVA